MGHSRSHDLSPIIISFPIVLVALGHVLHVLLSSPPRPEASRLACLNRIPIAVAAGRINRSQIFDFSSWMDERNWQFTMFHRCPAKRHTQSNDPSNGTFVASPCIPGKYISLVFKAFNRRYPLRDLSGQTPCDQGSSAPRAKPPTAHLYIWITVVEFSGRRPDTI